jgi:hypothetical protein
MNGKGSAPRPLAVPQRRFEAEYERIFGPRPKRRLRLVAVRPGPRRPLGR